MDVLIALGSSAAYFYSAVVCVLCLTSDSYTGAVFFETAALLISIVLLGRYVEHVAKGRTSEALSVLMGLQASTALLLLLDPLTGAVTGEEEVDANMVQRDDVLLVHRGAKVPCDGVVVSEESSSVDEALLTGEST
jgi:Cu+-exporting ATPase